MRAEIHAHNAATHKKVWSTNCAAWIQPPKCNKVKEGTELTAKYKIN